MLSVLYAPMKKVLEKVRFVKNRVLGLSTKLKIISVAGVLVVAVGSAVGVAALTGGDDSSEPVTTGAASTAKQNQQRSDSSAVKSSDSVVKDDEATKADEQDSETKEKQAEQSQQTATSQTNNTATTQTTNPPKQAGSIPKPKDQPPAPKADYNLNDGWYFAANYAGGTINTCWPTIPETEEEDNQCMGAHKDFDTIGIAKSASAAEQSAMSKMNQQAEAAHVILRKGAMQPGTKLTESLCSQYGLSCGTW